MAAAGENPSGELIVGVSDDSSQSSSKQLHVLAVDDSLVDRKVIERLLKISSCKGDEEDCELRELIGSNLILGVAFAVTAVESGRSALQYLGLDAETETTSLQFNNGLEVNLIITDYSMPEMTGYELLKKIKESSTLREIPVVIMSSENILARIDNCLKEGAEEFIVKPVKLSDVKRLKDFIMKGENEDWKVGTKRKLHLDHDHHPLSPGSPTTLPEAFGFRPRSLPLSRRSLITRSSTSKKPRFLNGD